jgi:acyl carrier protein
MLPDGCLIHLARKDFVIKIRGFRVDIGEVERALLSHPQLKEAGVAVWERDPGEKYLAAYIVARAKPAPRIDELRRFLKNKLPEYMIPSVFMFLEGLPLTNGKLDRKALPKPDHKRPQLSQTYVPARSEIESRLVEIWVEVLSLDQVGVHDNFFDLGGHSLAATRVISQVVKQFQLEIPLQLLFQSPTIAEMAGVISRHQGNHLSDMKLDRILTELEALSEEEAGKILAAQSDAAHDRGSLR